MILISLIISIISLLILVKGADFSIKYSTRIARILHMQEFIVSFFIISIISILPEASISIVSAIKGEPGLGLGTLIGSNITDLTLVLGLVALFSSKGIKIKSKILENNFFYIILIAFPVVLGFDGFFSRIDGLILFLAGTIFFIKIYLDRKKFRKEFNNENKEKKKSRWHFIKNFAFLLISLGVMLAGAIFTVKYSVEFANEIKIPAVLIGITVLAFGTCLPELTFSIKAIRKNSSGLALGDILGTVIADATIVLGLVAIISPFSHDIAEILIMGSTMVVAGILATIFMKTDKTIRKSEGLILIIFYLVFVFVQFIIHHVIRS